jgi:hypothetical protein
LFKKTVELEIEKRIIGVFDWATGSESLDIVEGKDCGGTQTSQGTRF